MTVLTSKVRACARARPRPAEACRHFPPSTPTRHNSTSRGQYPRIKQSYTSLDVRSCGVINQITTPALQAKDQKLLSFTSRSSSLTTQGPFAVHWHLLTDW
jgi:hypothetical protein